MTIHIRAEDDGEQYLETVARDLVIEVGSTGLPTVVPTGSLQRMASARPGWEEQIIFAEMAGNGTNEVVRDIHLRRPGRLREGTRLAHESGDARGVRLGAPGRIEVLVSHSETRAESDEIADRIAMGLS